MSSISTVNTGQSLLLQQLRAQEGAARPEGGQRPPSGPPPGFSEAVESAAEAAGLDASAISELRSEIEEAVQHARESGENRQGVKGAVDSILEAAGLDFESIRQDLRSLGGPQPGTYTAKSGQAETLSELFAEADDEETDALGLLDLLQRLPAGSLYDTNA